MTYECCSLQENDLNCGKTMKLKLVLENKPVRSVKYINCSISKRLEYKNLKIKLKLTRSKSDEKPRDKH